ncbi:MAG: NAD(P)H-dependent oxidoreductase subunit E [Planctomycetota bacterium]
MSAPVDLSPVDTAVAAHGRAPAALIPLLHELQKQYGYLPEEALRRLCATTEIRPAAVEGVASFFDGFTRRPAGRHRISVCCGTACHVKGADRVHDSFARALGLAAGEDTDAGGLFTLGRVACLGCCTLAPAVRIDEITYGHVRADGVGRVQRDFLDCARIEAGPAARAAAGDGQPVVEVRVGLGSCCQAGGSAAVYRALERELARAGAAARVKRVGCTGMCHRTPLVEVVAPGQPPRLYAKVEERDVPALVRRHFPRPGFFGRLGGLLARGVDRLLTDEAWAGVERHALDVRDRPVADFLGRQRRIATEGSGEIDPLDVDEYVARGGFAGLDCCLTALSPGATVERIVESGLRGRGGAGFPAGRKWLAVRRAPGERKLVLVNGDEGDPGAFMDRMILESSPFRVLEGLAIAAWAVGAREGIFYVRAEYPLAVERVRAALATCRERGLLARDGFALEVEVARGAGAFVCGEETALIASLEGRRGMPRLRPPWPAEQGLFGRPTLVNNVETLALVPWIVRHGPEAFRALGTARSPGTKVFALAGKVVRGGLVEVPLGISVREVVEEIGGGVAPGRTLKAVQIGGPSGGCVPAELADTPVDYERLFAVGSMMGSGGFVVLDDTDCMVDVARYFLAFTQNQSCGRCTPCRIGTKRLLEIVDRVRTGRGRPDDLARLEELSRQVAASSLCGLGRTAPNPVLSTLRHFRAEWEAHLAGRCPAGRCRDLVAYVVTDGCIGCTVCAQRCPVDAIAATPYVKHAIDTARCTRCDVCREACPVNAVEVVSPCPA